MSIQSAPERPTAASGSIRVRTAATAERGSLREAFERRHWLKLPGLLDEALLERVRGDMDRGEFEEHEHQTAHKELCLRPGKALAMLMFLANDPGLFGLVREITGCERISAFKGRVYRMLPGPAHAGTWHDDVANDRMVAMSVNLGKGPYAGGVLEIRDRESKEVLGGAANTGPGDALLFQISRSLQHRLTAVEGDTPKTAYAGWFGGGEDSRLLRPDAALEPGGAGSDGEGRVGDG